MCGGGGGVLGKVFGGVSKLLFGSPSDKGIVFNAPAPSQPAPPAPSRKQDTGATVIVGADSVDDRLSDTLKNKKRTSLSSLGGAGGAVSGINI